MTRIQTLLAILALGSASAIVSVPGFAQPADRPMGGPMMGDPGSGRQIERMQARQQRLHDALKLTPEQEGAWNQFQATRPSYAGYRPDRAELTKLTAPERADKMLELQQQHLNAMTSHVAALKTFYGQLTAEQQKTFDDHMATSPRGLRGTRGGRGPGPQGPGNPPPSN